MARLARVVIPDYPHHVAHRGNRREDVFFSDADRRAYLADLHHCAKEAGLRVWGFCLMSNHVHLIAVPEDEDSLAAGIRRAHQRHTRRINKAKGWTGHLWGGRYYSTALDADHLWAAIRYVELNPVRAGLVQRAEDWPWSSAQYHCDLRRKTGLLDPARPFGGSQRHPQTGVKISWSAWLELGLKDEEIDRIRLSTSTGRPCGSVEFVDSLEEALSRRLKPQKRGPRGLMNGEAEGQMSFLDEA